jgi:hypothetical protein
VKLFGISFGKKKGGGDDDDDWDDEEDEEDEEEDEEEDDEEEDEESPRAGAAGGDDPRADDRQEGAAEDAPSDDAEEDISEDEIDDEEEDEEDDWDEDDEDDDGEGGRGAGKFRLIAIGAGALVLLGAAGGGAWWFLSNDAAPQTGATRATPEGPRVVVDVPPKRRAPGGGLLTPPAGKALTAPRPGQDPAAAQSPAPGGAVGQAGAVAGAAPGSLNAVSSSIREPGAGIVVPAVSQVAFANVPAAAPGQPLAAVPDPALIEQTAQGTLPKIGEDGRMAWQVYARPFEDNGQRPRIVVIIGGLGLSRAATEAAVGRLPGAVTLAFDPYAKGLQDWVSRARQAGHEVLLSLPMEPAAFPLYDPGPLALLTSLAPEANLGRLAFLLGRISGYVGVVSAHGSKFTTEKTHFLPVLEFLKQRGLMYVDNGSTKKSLATPIASEIGLPSTVSNVNLDFDLSRPALDSRLAKLEETARKNKTAVVMASPYPVVLERLAAWIGTLDKKGLVVAPVSSLPVPSAAPPAAPKPAKP